MTRRLTAVGAAACVVAALSPGTPVARASDQAAPTLPPELTQAIAYYSTLICIARSCGVDRSLDPPYLIE